MLFLTREIYIRIFKPLCNVLLLYGHKSEQATQTLGEHELFSQAFFTLAYFFKSSLVKMENTSVLVYSKTPIRP